MSTALTPTEENVYRYLIAFLAENSYQPSIREIGREFSIKSTKTVSDVLGSLARKGYIQRNQARSRGLRILGAQPTGATRAVPYYSRLAALGPAFVDAFQTDAIVIDRRLVPSGAAVFLRVGDDAMAPHGIRHNDTVLVNPAATALDGDLVAIRAEHDAVVRMFGHRGDTGLLHAAADDMTPRSVMPGDEQVVLGIVCGVFRGAWQSVSTGDPSAEAA